MSQNHVWLLEDGFGAWMHDRLAFLICVNHSRPLTQIDAIAPGIAGMIHEMQAHAQSGYGGSNNANAQQQLLLSRRRVVTERHGNVCQGSGQNGTHVGVPDGLLA